MDDASTLGSRIQAARLMAGLTQRELAARSGVSITLVRQLEQENRTSAKLVTVHKLAGALSVTTSRLSGGTPDADPAVTGDIAQWEAVRQAALGYHAAPCDGEPCAGDVAAELKSLVAMALGARHAELRAALPGVLAGADALVAADDGERPRLLRSTARQLAAYGLGQTWQLGAAGDVLRAAADDAAGDPGTEMAAAAWLAWVLLRSGDLDGCASLVSDRADKYEPPIARAGFGELAGWGRFQVLLATCAARDSRPGEALDALRWARAAAAAAGREGIPAANPLDPFGPTSVELAAAEVAMVRGRPGETLAIAAQIDTRRVLVPRNVLRHQLDVARALVEAPAGSGLRDHAKAVKVLGGVRDAAPEWLAQQRGAADIVRAVMKPRRKLTADLADLARLLHVIP